jgi:pyruvate/2-oxoglutarate dehydrogenase complex dihydrolipoamide dehydrogenase (E3) component
VAGLYAIGDLVGPPWLAHKGMHEGVIVAERIAGVKGVHPLDVSKVPGCTYCWPQVASVGMTEANAKASGRKIKVGHFPFIGNGKAIALGDPEGMVKTVFDADTGELLGAHMIGAEVTELIQGYTIARTPRRRMQNSKKQSFRIPRCRKCCTKPCSMPTRRRCIFELKIYFINCSTSAAIASVRSTDVATSRARPLGSKKKIESECITS